MDLAVSALARRQHGVVSLEQLLGLGVSIGQIKHRLRVGRLFAIHQGVYAVGHPTLDRAGRWMAATLVCPGAVLSHRTAAAAFNLLRPTGTIHVTAPRPVRIAAPIEFHCRTLPADERADRPGPPVTSLARTLWDVAASEGSVALARALREAHFRHLRDRLSLPDLLERYPGRPGSRAVRAVLERRTYVLRTRSDLEGDFLEFVCDCGLPLPETNAIVAVGSERFEVDCLWRRQRLIVEVDAYSSHGTPESMEADRRRDGLLQSAGWSVHRVTASRFAPANCHELERQLRSALA